MKNTTSKKLINRSILYSLLLLLLTFAFINITFAQTKDIRFEHLMSDQGLSQNWVQWICQDKHGYIWIATQDGLNRYDGQNFVIYRHNRKDETSMSSNMVPYIYEDHHGNLWIGTQNGLDLYDYEYNRFIHNPRWPSSGIIAICEDDIGNLWLGTANSLAYLDLKNDTSFTYLSNNDIRYKGYLSNNAINYVTVDSKKNIWIGSLRGLNLYDRNRKSFINYYHEDKDPNSLDDDVIRTILEDKEGRLWIGTNSGLNLFTNAKDRPLKGIFKHYQNNEHNPNSISKGSILSLLEDTNHQLWIGIENGGLDRLDLDSYNNQIVSFTHFKNNPNKSTSLSNNSVHAIFQDRQSNLWIGTYGKGIDVISPSRNKFTHIMNELGNQNSLCNNLVNAIFEEINFVWIGTEGGLDRYDKRNGTFRHFVHVPSISASLGANPVWAICKDHRGKLWIGTWGGGLNLFDNVSETFTHYLISLPNARINTNNIFSIIEDKKGILWLGTMGGGLVEFDPRSKKYFSYNDSTSNLSVNYIPKVIEVKNGDLWLSNIGSLSRFDRSAKQFERFIHNSQQSTSLTGSVVICLFEDSHENLWIGTDEGLDLLDRSTKQFTHYQMEDGLPSNFINSILEDNKGNLWIATNKGLTKFVKGSFRPQKPQFVNYTTEDGLQGDAFSRRSCFKGSDGLLYFGGLNGYNVFDPDKIIENTYIPTVLITDFQIFNKSATIGLIDSPLKKHISVADDITLSYKHSVFSFEYVALDFPFSTKNQFAYKLEGFDQDWNYVGKKRNATYTNINPGEYVFKVKASLNSNVWDSEGKSIHITITPPFYQTFIFKLLIAVIVVIISFISYKRIVRARQLAERLRIDEAIANERNLLRTLIDNWPDYIYIKDLQGHFIIANKAILRKHGFKTENEIIGKTDFDLFPQERATQFFAEEQSIIRTGKGVYDQEGAGVDPSRGTETIWNSTTKVPIRDVQGTIVGIVGIAQDITDRKKAEIERERLITDLQNALSDIKKLSGLVPICSNCKKIRDDKGYWTQVEAYIQEHSEARFSHGVCPDCFKILYPNYHLEKKDQI